MPDTPQPPRRRISDRDRRRWNDQALDLLDERVESHAQDIEDMQRMLRDLPQLRSEFSAFRREFDEWKAERRDDVTELRTDIRELRGENRRAHKRVAYGRDPETAELLPATRAALTWGAVLKVASAVSLVLGPIAVIVAALLQGGG